MHALRFSLKSSIIPSVCHFSRVGKVDLLLMRHLLYLFLALHSLRLRFKNLYVGDPLWFMRFRVPCTFAVQVKPGSPVHVLGVTRVEASVNTLEHVNVEGDSTSCLR